MLERLGYIQFRTHRVSISKDLLNDRIYCFKHTDHRCDLESFNDLELAQEYIVTPFSAGEYRLELDD